MKKDVVMEVGSNENELEVDEFSFELEEDEMIN